MKARLIWNVCGLLAGLFVVQFWLIVTTRLAGHVRYSATVFLIGAFLSVLLSLAAGLKASKYWFLVTGSIAVTLLIMIMGSR